MGEHVFGNEFFDRWLDHKTNEVQEKMIRHESLNSDDMLVLTIKGQSNHFHHLDIEFREEFKKIDKRFEQMYMQFEKRFEQIDKRFEQVDKRFEQVDKRFEQIDKRFQSLITILLWAFGLITTLLTGLYLTKFL